MTWCKGISQIYVNLSWRDTVTKLLLALVILVYPFNLFPHPPTSQLMRVPIFLVILVSGGMGYLPQCYLQSSFFRLCCSTAVIESVFLLLTWLMLLDKEEKAFVTQKIQKVLRRKA